MKRTFKCQKCGNEFEIEADYFVPGISGTVVLSNGVRRDYVDPTGDHTCPDCIKEALLPYVVEVEREDA